MLRLKVRQSQELEFHSDPRSPLRGKRCLFNNHVHYSSLPPHSHSHSRPRSSGPHFRRGEMRGREEERREGGHRPQTGEEREAALPPSSARQPFQASPWLPPSTPLCRCCCLRLCDFFRKQARETRETRERRSSRNYMGGKKEGGAVSVPPPFLDLPSLT